MECVEVFMVAGVQRCGQDLYHEGGDGEFATESLASRKMFPMIHVRSLSGASLVERFVYDSRSCIHAELLISFEVDLCY